jgi:hypothetical protein
MTTIEQPCDTFLHLPSGRVVRLHSKTTTLQQERGIVTLVSVLPLSTLVPFEVAIAKVEEIAREQGVQDRRFYDTVAEWRSDSGLRNSSTSKYEARAILEPQVNLYAKVRPHPTETGWFIAIDLQRTATQK